MASFRPFFNAATGEWAQYTAIAEGTLSALLGAISISRAVDDPDLSQQILAGAAAALETAQAGLGPRRSGRGRMSSSSSTMARDCKAEGDRIVYKPVLHV
jgi:hypothetical protein